MYKTIAQTKKYATKCVKSEPIDVTSAAINARIKTIHSPNDVFVNILIRLNPCNK